MPSERHDRLDLVRSSNVDPKVREQFLERIKISSIGNFWELLTIMFGSDAILKGSGMCI